MGLPAAAPAPHLPRPLGLVKPASGWRPLPRRLPWTWRVVGLDGVFGDIDELVAARAGRISPVAPANKNARTAYYRTVTDFFAWLDAGTLVNIEPLHMAAASYTGGPQGKQSRRWAL